MISKLRSLTPLYRLAIAACLMGLMGQGIPPALAQTTAPPAKLTQPDTLQAATCPAALPASTRCYSHPDSTGAFILMAIPAQWNQVLVVHAHGGPELGVPRLSRTEEDLSRWAITVKAGYAWVGSTYRRGGYGVTMAALDTERARQFFVQHFGEPRRTLLHGQSYGGGVASKTVELFATAKNGRSPYDAVLLTNAVLGGGTTAYNFRLDLRAVYQHLCHNHPRTDEPQYPLWMGLPTDAKLTRTELAQRVNECTGLRLPAGQRSPLQQQHLSDILNVLKIPERSLMGHLNWATWLFEDMVANCLEGRSPWGNEGVRYQGSSDDAALNAGVLRYQADPTAVAALATDSLPTGELHVPVLTLHAIHDPVAFVELESNYRDIVAKAGRANSLVQVFSDESEHSYLSDPEYTAAFKSLLDWVEGGTQGTQGSQPTPQSIADLCETMRGKEGAKEGSTCHLRPTYQPAPLGSRVALRSAP